MNNIDKLCITNIKRRIYTKTQNSKSKYKPHLSNKLFFKYNTYGTVDSHDKSSQGSLYKYQKVRSSSNKNLFEKAKFNDGHTLYNKTNKSKKIDNFMPSKIKGDGQSIDKEGKKKKVISSLMEQMSNKNKPELKIHRNNELPTFTKNNVNNSLLNSSINDNKSMISRRKIEQIINLKFESRKQNLQKSQRIMTQLIENATQTQFQVHVQNIYSQNKVDNKKNSIKNQILNKEKNIQVKKQKTLNYEQIKPQSKKVQIKKQVDRKKQPQKKQTQVIHEKRKDFHKIQKQKTQKQQNKKKNYYNNIEQYTDQIQSIDLKSVHLKQQKKSKTKTQENQKTKVDYQKPDQLSFINKKQPNKPASERNKRMQSSQSDELKDLKLSPQSKVSSLKPKKTVKQKVKQQFQKADYILNVVTPIGEIAPQCTTHLKKSKLNWHQPAMLLYKQCHTIYKRHQKQHQKALEYDLIKNEDFKRYIQQNEIITRNLQKMLNSFMKKKKIREQYIPLLSSSSQTDLQKYIHQQVISFNNQLLQAQIDNIQTLKCGIRMINGVFLLAKLRGKQINQINIQNQGNKQVLKKIILENLNLLKGKKLL